MYYKCNYMYKSLCNYIVKFNNAYEIKVQNSRNNWLYIMSVKGFNSQK